MQRLRELVDGKSVALVGNATSILKHDLGAKIDSHEVVIRMNLGLPGRLPPRSIGTRTSVWLAGRYWKGVEPKVDLCVFMKLTKLGDVEWDQFVDSIPPFPLVRWERSLEDECRAFVGADPGTGIRALWWLKKRASPASVNVFGMDCWRTPSHWSGKMNTPNHKPALEREALEKLLA